MKRTPLRPRTTGLVTRTSLSRSTPLLASAKGTSAATRGRGLAPVSARRKRENRERAKMADQLWPERREGTVMCECGRPECRRRATDLHEPKFRSRLGSITDPKNAIPVSRECHEWIHAHPEEAAELGLAVHSWQ